MNSKSTRTLNWAIKTLDRHKEILAGHCWRPSGWQNCVLRFWTGEFDNESITVEAIETKSDGSTRTWIVAWRVQPDEVEQEIQECLLQLRTLPDPTYLGELASVPLPEVPFNVIQKLRSDMSDTALRTFGEAASVIRFLRE